VRVSVFAGSSLLFILTDQMTISAGILIKFQSKNMIKSTFQQINTADEPDNWLVDSS
jgi:hypothetical protein